MGWSLGHDSRWGKYGRDIGYGVPATCDHPGCNAEIDRGLGYVCGGDVYGGEHGCGLFFCGSHLFYCSDDEITCQRCERCCADEEPFEPTPDTKEWIDWKLSDESWATWRAENSEEVAGLTNEVAQATHAAPVVQQPREAK
jgi:hypothetical protein